MCDSDSISGGPSGRQKRSGVHDRGVTGVVNTAEHPLDDQAYRADCKQQLDKSGVLVLDRFLTQESIEAVRATGHEHQHLAYYTASDHNVYLSPQDSTLDSDHPRNRLVTSSKGCITTDQIPGDSVLHSLYKSDAFKEFLCTVLDEEVLFEYADPLSSINLHYAAAGQELGWHYDNSSFAITLLIQKPEGGAVFEYVKDARGTDSGAYDLTGKILDGRIPVENVAINEGSLVLFRGRNSIHRVTPTTGDITRMLVVFAYNSKSGVRLSESARMTFYGRLE